MLFQKRDGSSEEICTKHNALLTENANTKNLFDADAIIKSSIASTERYELSKFDECLRFHQKDDTNGHVFGKYCVLAFNSTASPNLKYTGVCYPDSCSDSVLQKLTEASLGEEQSFQNQWCQTKNLEYQLIDKCSISFFALLFLVVVLSTIYDYCRRNAENKKRWLTTFSLYSNVKKVFKTTSSDDMNCLYALRTLSVFWLIIANRFNALSMFPMADEVTHNKWHKNGFSAFVAASDMAYDTFFMVSGFLLATYCMQAYAAKSMNYLHLLMHRYFRYVPLLAATIIFYVSLFKFTVTGPLAYRLTQRIENCQHYWWTTILLVENYVTPNNTCLYDGWYFNVDFQFFIVLPLLVLIFYKFRKVGFVILYTLLIGIYTSVLTFLILYDSPYNVINRISALPIHSHFRCAPWIISILLASVCMKDELKMKKSFRTLCWLGTYAIFIAHFVAVYLLQNKEYAADSVVAGAIFASVHRILWSLAIAWIIVACVMNESNGIVSRCLNSPKWKPFGKLSITLLIIHPLYQTATTFSMRAPYAFDSWWTFHAGVGDILLTTILAVFLYASIELPFVTIEQSFHVKKKHPEEMQEVQVEKAQ